MSPLDSSVPVATRWQSFRQRNRDKPLHQALAILGMSVCILSFGYLFFYQQPDRSYTNVVSWNAAMALRTQQLELQQLEEERIEQAMHERPSHHHRSIFDYLMRLLSIFSFTILYCRLRTCLRSLHRSARENVRRRSPQQARNEAMTATSAGGNNINNNNRQSVAHANAWSQAWNNRPQDTAMAAATLPISNRYDEDSTRRGGASLDVMIAACPVRILEPQDELLRRRGELSQCQICLDPFSVRDTIRTIPCFHVFHRECIDGWLEQQGMCPVCSHPLL
jgi:hypothetical protein